MGNVATAHFVITTETTTTMMMIIAQQNSNRTVCVCVRDQNIMSETETANENAVVRSVWPENRRKRNKVK